jgi:hypothetical protein
VNHYFKMYLKNTAAGAITGATLGMVCGAGAGVAGLKQAVAYNMQLEEDKAALITTAALVGGATGLGIGAVVGAIAYPIYEMIVKRGCLTVSDLFSSMLNDAEGPVLRNNNEPRRLQV